MDGGEGLLTGTAVIGTLRTRETAFWPAIGRAVSIEEGVLLFETEPRNVLLGLVHNFVGMMTIVSPVWGAIVVVGFCENKDVVASTERILEDSGRTEVDIGVVARGLVGRRTVEVPDTEGANVGDLLTYSLEERNR